ncbi:MAG TPA: hypothetical protein VMV77_05750 [Bacteroidales bacterium]|nr:hypothetical protein [Bacteroidales bacterium]
MAKELCMIENNEQGKKARVYFIQMEKLARQHQISLPTRKELAQIAGVRTKRIFKPFTGIRFKVIAEQKIRTQRILGQLIKEGQERGEIRTSGNPDKFNCTQKEQLKDAKTLSDIGISRKESSTFQTIASIPE